MDELKIIFWIIIGLVYLFSRGRKKAAPPPAKREASEDVDVPSSPGKAVTFEDLLREIQEMKRPAPQEPPPTHRPPGKKEPEYVDYDDEIEEEEKEVVEDTQYDYRNQDKIYQVYEDAKKQAFERPSLEETVKLQDTVVRFDAFRNYKQDSRRNLTEDYLKDFKDPQGFRKAFIMSEILKRKF